MTKKSSVPKNVRVRIKNQKYYKANRTKILKTLFYRDIKRMKTKSPNRHTIRKFGLTPRKCRRLKMTALAECGVKNIDEAVEKYRYYNNLEKFVASRQK